MPILSLAAALLALQPAPPPPNVIATERSRRARALTPLAALFSMDDYPDEAFRGNATGIVQYELVVGTNGTPARCTVTRSSSNRALDRATCDILMTRARFSPALDDQGRPIEDRLSSRVRWELPAEDDYRIPFSPLVMSTELTIAADGSVRCIERLNQFDYEPTEDPCGDLADLDPASLFGGEGRTGTVNLILTIVPDGERPPSGDGVRRGTPAIEGSARLSVAPGGRVADCRMTRRPDPRGDAGLAQLADLCRLPSFDMENMFRPALRQLELRSATLTLQLYLRRDAESPARR